MLKIKILRSRMPNVLTCNYDLLMNMITTKEKMILNHLFHETIYNIWF